MNLILSLVAAGKIEGGALEFLFCPGDYEDSLLDAGGPGAYVGLDLSKQGEHDHLSSYAGLDLLDPKIAAKAASHEPVVLVCDDSDDHHDGRGIVVGLTGGSVTFRHKVDDWKLDVKTPVEVGPNSVVPELRCLRRD